MAAHAPPRAVSCRSQFDAPLPNTFNNNWGNDQSTCYRPTTINGPIGSSQSEVFNISDTLTLNNPGTVPGGGNKHAAAYCFATWRQPEPYRQRHLAQQCTNPHEQWGNHPYRDWHLQRHELHRLWLDYRDHEHPRRQQRYRERRDGDGATNADRQRQQRHRCYCRVKFRIEGPT